MSQSNTLSFEEKLEDLISSGWQIVSVMHFVKQSTYTVPGRWRITLRLLHSPTIFGMGWGQSLEASLSSALADHAKQVALLSRPAKPKELSLDDLDL